MLHHNIHLLLFLYQNLHQSLQFYTIAHHPINIITVANIKDNLSESIKAVILTFTLRKKRKNWPKFGFGVEEKKRMSVFLGQGFFMENVTIMNRNTSIAFVKKGICRRNIHFPTGGRYRRERGNYVKEKNE